MGNVFEGEFELIRRLIVKKRNLRLAGIIGTRALTGILVAIFLVSSPVLADEITDAGQWQEATEESTEEAVRPSARLVDGTGTFVEVSDEVWAQIESQEIWYDEATGFLKDTATGAYVDPLKGDRVASLPSNKATDKTEENQNKDSSTEASSESKTEDSSKDQKEEETTEDQQESSESKEEASESKEEEAEAEKEENSGSNEELIANQNIVAAPEIYQDFRFWQITKKYSFAKKDNTLILEEIPSEKAGQSQADVRVVGSLSKKAVAYVIKEVNDNWLYVESGTARGFVKKSDMYTGQEAKKVLKAYEKKAKKLAKKNKKSYQGIDSVVKLAVTKIPASDNQAFTYLRATTNQTLVSKDYALVNSQVSKTTGSSYMNIYDSKDTGGNIVGSLREGGLCYILADKTGDWVYIESGDVRGFVKKEFLTMGDEAKLKVTQAGEDSFATATELVESKENKALYYTLTSVKEASKGSAVRNAILEFASQFVGNPYVWGGTSLTEGADCSGFVQQIYLNFGYSLPRVAEDQAQYGMQIPVEDAAPGDLIFYAENGYIYHVVMYAGDGKTIEAANEDVGIIYGNVDQTDAVWATRILDDDETTATESLTGGNLFQGSTSNTSIFGL